MSGVISQVRTTANTTKAFILGAGSGQARLGFGRLDSQGTTLYTDLGSAKTDKQTRSAGVDMGIKHLF